MSCKTSKNMRYRNKKGVDESSVSSSRPSVFSGRFSRNYDSPSHSW